MGPHEVPLRPPDRYPRSAAGQILASIARQYLYESRQGRTPGKIRMDRYKINRLAESYGRLRGGWVIFGLPVEEVWPQVCLDVVPAGSVLGWFDRRSLDEYLRAL